MTTFDVIIIGAGAMGSAAAYHLSKRGIKTLLLEQFELDHMNGSSYGNSRIIRYSYDEPEYIKLAKEVYPLWHGLEADSGKKLWHVTGGIDFGDPAEQSIINTIRSVQSADIAYEVLSPTEANHRFPQFHFPDNFTVLYQPDSGMLNPSLAVVSQVALAQQHGAQVVTNAPVIDITVTENDVTVKTNDGTFSAAKLILACGSWTNDALAMIGGNLQLPLQTLRAQLNQFAVAEGYDSELYTVKHMPTYIYHRNMAAGEGLYGIGDHDGVGVKVAFHGGEAKAHPREVNRTPDPENTEAVRETLTRHYMPGIAEGKLLSSRICLYTNTPDQHFVVDVHPYHDNVVIGTGFSGHGFKFSTGIGKILGELATYGVTEHEVRLFKIKRFLQAVNS